MRAFIGIEFSSEVKKRIIDFQNIIRHNSVRGRWKYIDNFHLTLKFIGEISKEKTIAIYRSMEEVIEPIKSFSISTDGLGFFRGDGCLRVVYLKLDDDEKKLSRVFKIVEDACASSGIEREKRSYTPHITIAQDVYLSKDIKELEGSITSLGNINIHVKSVNIIKSEQLQNKRVYSTVYSIGLKS